MFFHPTLYLPIQLLDVSSGKDLLRGNFPARNHPPTYNVVIARKKLLRAYVRQSLKCQADTRDGVYLFRDDHNPRDESLVRVENGLAIIPVSRTESCCKRVPASSLVRALESIINPRVDSVALPLRSV